MNNRCKIVIKNFEILVVLKNNATSKTWDSLPIKSKVKTWGEEVYFYTSIDTQQESDAKEVINFGELAFWPDGKAIAIGFGKTPISQGEEIRLAARCNIWGTTEFNFKKLKENKMGNITIEKYL